MNFDSYLIKDTKLSFTTCFHSRLLKLENKQNAQPVKKVAFTLAEVLITLTIIGVIAAMTVPTLL